MKVKAIQMGYYQHKRRREGEVFELEAIKGKDGQIIPAEKQFSAKWMAKVGSKKVEAQDEVVASDVVGEPKPRSRKPKEQ